MKNVCVALLFLGISGSSFAQDDRPEDVQVTGSRITSTPFGPLHSSGPSSDHPCAEPNCGKDDFHDDYGSSALQQQQKTTNNKKAKEKAKQVAGQISPSIKGDSALWSWFLGWFKNISVDMGVNVDLKVTLPNGASVTGSTCAQQHTKVNQEGGQPVDYCVQRRVDIQTVEKSNKVREIQAKIEYKIYNKCYWEKTCGVETITFIAGSPAELADFLNETTGEAIL